MATNFDDHIQRLDQVLQRLGAAGLKVNPSKCEFFQAEVLFLGHIVGQDGIRPNPKTIAAVMAWQEPKSVKEIQQFLGLCSYYRQYIPNFSHIAAPLTYLTKKNVTFNWDTSCQTSFETLREKLCSAPVLAYPRPHQEYILDTDASDVGIGAVLSQIQEGQERVIAYASKRLNIHQERYSVTKRELLAVITFVNHFRHYLLGQRFIIRTDHGSLQWLLRFKDPRGQVARWLEVLGQYNYKIIHRASRKNGNADSLSRRDQIDLQCKHEVSNPSECEHCAAVHEEWADFFEDVDTVQDIGYRPIIRELTVTEKEEETRLQSSFLPCYKSLEISNMQKEDDDLGTLHEWFNLDDMPDRDEVTRHRPALRKYWLNSDNIVRLDGVLYQKRYITAEKYRHQLLVPKILRKEIIQNHHSVSIAGHFGVNKTSVKIREKFHWYRMDHDIRLYIRCCHTCNKHKTTKKKPRARLKNYLVGHPLDRIGIDVMGPLPLSPKGNRYILVVGDYFTRWMEAYPIPNQQADVIADRIVNQFISHYGTPLEIHSDQGRNFESELFAEVLKLLEIKKTRTTPYRPSSNGLIEKFNSTLGKMISKSIRNNGRNWDLHIDYLMAAYRSTPHSTTGYSPNYMMFGREVGIPSSILYPTPDHNKPCEQHEYVKNLRERLEECYQYARENLKVAAERQKRDYDARISENEYAKGDVVYKRAGLSKKLEAKYQGPFVVSKVLSSTVYEIRGKQKSYIVH